MCSDRIGSAAAGLETFTVVRANDTAELDARSRVSDRLPGRGRDYRYRLRDRALWHRRFEAPIFTLATRSAGSILVSHGESRFATEVAIEGESDLLCLTTMLRGDVTVIQQGEPASGTLSCGLVFRPGHGTGVVTSDDSLRTNVFIKAVEVENALEHMLDARLRKPLEFSPHLDWTRGLAASLRFQLDFVMHEFGRPDGVADNPVALASTTDLLAALILRATHHNHSGMLEAGRGVAVPAYVQRAEEFMRTHCDTPIRMTDIAAAAGCSLRTLSAVFRHFRDRTPLAVLHGIRLQQVHAELSRGESGTTPGAVARRYGFSNASRFAAAFRRRFGEAPAEVLRRASRP
ncbi:helix-turn-helix transcriptional regulator [Falsiroseomonas bella]|nr:helix-turn-helix domain-containing protein [Falsiroseomonas bella]